MRKAFQAAVRGAALLLYAGCALAGPLRAATFPTYDQVYSLSGHNSYFANNVFEPFVSGNDQRLSDVLLHEHAGMIEIDIKKAEPGRWRVYHSYRLPGFNTQCEYLDECLMRLQNLQFALPQHEVVNVAIELKETEPLLIHQSVPDVFDASHTVDQLDATIRRFLGPALFTPNDFMNVPACAGAATLIDCAARRSWPTTDQLRGKFIVNVSGNWSSNHFNWAVYATQGNGIRARAAFPMRSVFDSCGNGVSDGGGYFPGKPIPAGTLSLARRNSIFWEVYDRGGKPVFQFGAAEGCPAFEAEGRDFLTRQHGILRSTESYGVSQQQGVVANGFHFPQTDWAWELLKDGNPAPSDFVTDVTRRLNDPFRVRGTVRLDRAALIEPGNRIYIYNFTSSDSIFHFREERPDTAVTWEAVVASGGVDTTNDDSHPPVRGEDGKETSRGDGCLRAEAADGLEWVMVCRRLLLKGEDALTPTNDQTRVVVSVQARSAVDGNVNQIWKSSRSTVNDGIGDMLRMRIENRRGGATADLSSASALSGFNILGQPAYLLLRQVRFAGPLVRQGLWAQGDKLFVRPRFTALEPRDITLCDLPGSLGNARRSGVIDFSFPVSCPARLPLKRVPPAEPYCPSYESGLCYEACRPGFTGVGPICYEPCRAGYADDGLFCRLDARIISADNSACPWYDKCAQGIIDRKPIGWCSTCPPPNPDGRRWKNDGCTCRLDADIYPKTGNYSRGAGWVPGSR